MGILKDHRSRDTRPIKAIGLWYVATDRVLSGWGMAEGGKSYVAYPAPDNYAADHKLAAWLADRKDFQRVRLNTHLPRMGAHDHTSVYDVPEEITGG
jgi:hypothetical protein